MSTDDEKRIFIEFLRSGKKQEIDTKDGGYLVPETLPVYLPGFRAYLWRCLAGVYLYFGLYGSYWMAYIKGVRFVNTIEYLKEKMERNKI